MKVWIVALALTLSACANTTPPNLTPQASIAFKATQVVHALDLIRDTADSAQQQTPPLVSAMTLRKIVGFHTAAVSTIQATPNGWRPTVEAGLDGLLSGVPAAEAKMLRPYVGLAHALIQEVGAR